MEHQRQVKWLGQEAAGGPYWVYAQLWEWKDGIWISTKQTMFDSFEHWQGQGNFIGYDEIGVTTDPPPYLASVIWRWITTTNVANGQAKSPANRWEMLQMRKNWDRT